MDLVVDSWLGRAVSHDALKNLKGQDNRPVDQSLIKCSIHHQQSSELCQEIPGSFCWVIVNPPSGVGLGGFRSIAAFSESSSGWISSLPKSFLVKEIRATPSSKAWSFLLLPAKHKRMQDNIKGNPVLQIKLGRGLMQWRVSLYLE